jgi:hypothetical protein
MPVACRENRGSAVRHAGLTMTMTVAQPVLETPESLFGAVVARQLSAWPFAARTTRLFLLVEPSLPDEALRRGLLRAMQQAYFRSDGLSQTRAVREAVLAAHYVLRHRNRDALSFDQVNAATAVAALRGARVFVALAGDAAAFARRDGVLTSQRATLRSPRPLGLEQDPRVTLWSTPLGAEDQLVLVCGATWPRDVSAVIDRVMRTTPSSDSAQQQLAEALGGSRPAGVLVVGESRHERHPSIDPAPERGPAQATRQRPESASPRRWPWLLACVVLLAATGIAALSPSGEPGPLDRVRQARALLAESEQTDDMYQAHALVATALNVAQSVPGSADLVDEAAQALDRVDRVVPVTPAMAARLGPSGVNVVDLAVGDDAVYTLDVVEGSVRAFLPDGRDQSPTPDTLVARAGTPVGPAGPAAHRLALPVAIAFLNGAGPGPGVLTIVDQARTTVQVAHDRALSVRPLPGSSAWREVGALGSDGSGDLYVLDSAARRLMEYVLAGQRPVDAPPRVLLDATSQPGLAFDRVSKVLGDPGAVILRMDDGTLHRFDADGNRAQIEVSPPDGRQSSVAAFTSDRAGGLYLADPAHARILHVRADGAFVRQFRDPALAGVREIQSSPDGQRLYGLVASGVLVFDIPPM